MNQNSLNTNYFLADQGDCCPQSYTIRNGQCNPENINAHCLFDKGDCCGEFILFEEGGLVENKE